MPGSRNDNLPSAPSALRAKGIYNYKAAYNPDLTGYAYNVSYLYSYQLTHPLMPAVSNDYVNRGIPSYDLSRIWRADVYDDPQLDEYRTYKHWLTTPMMNYYVAPIKEIINLNIVPGKHFYNLHINANVFGFGTEPGTGFTYSKTDYWYFVYSARYIRFIPAPLMLSEL